MDRRSRTPGAFGFLPSLSSLAPLVGVVVVAGALVAAVELTIAAFSSAGIGSIAQRNLYSMLISVGVIAAGVGVLWTATNRLGISLALVAAGMSFTLMLHIRKVQLIDRPLMPWDFLEWRQVTSLAPTLLPGGGAVVALGSGLLLVALCAALVRAVALGRPRFPLSWGMRRNLALVSVASLLGVIFQQHLPIGRIFNRFGIYHQVWDQRSNYRVNGLTLMMLWNWEGLRLDPGAAYSEERVYAALGSSPGVIPSAPPAPVDVVILMAESLWDPTRLGVPLSADPLPFFRSLLSSHSSGALISPGFGGGTANSEFELLTGMSSSFVPQGAFPYQHYLLRPVDALPSLFRRAGYRTVAIHPFHAFYWSRDLVYPLLGFDAFQSLTDFPSPRLEGPWVSDEEVVDHVLDELSDERQPHFVMAVTMSTHGPYNLPLTGQERIDVLGTKLSPPNQLLVKNYANKLLQMDTALERLVRRLESRKRRTLLVVFGDHLPMLGLDYASYREAGYFAEPWTDAQRERMAEVPVVLWTNYPVPRQDIHMSISMLTPRILETAGLRPPAFFAFVSELSKVLPVVRGDVLRTASGEYLPAEDHGATAPRAWADWMRRYRLLTYDRLVGENFSAARTREAVSTYGARPCLNAANTSGAKGDGPRSVGCPKGRRPTLERRFARPAPRGASIQAHRP
ncbi:LTA synthase family protein [Myxococcus sp. K15C18031901]|uniref:LTA synthase family protein n=1 Tax=Myxococcus dinghuensis TaxID=2906761 RepID=UPI0020A7D269|nr:LTA synthase family protein [Myxococcus dinghuensis]MCP3103689.1 LTA synthase family protein [Myxococcus dinghuensis]